MDGPYIRVEDSGLMIPLREDVTTIGRGRSVDVQLADPSVSRLHAEIVRRGPYAYVADLGLSRNGTRVNGRLVARRVLEDGDVLSLGSARCRVFGIVTEELTAEAELRKPAAPELTRRELDVVTSLCRPALSDEAFVAPATAREIAADLVVTEAAVKQHLLRLYQKFRIPEGAGRRVRLANEVVALGLVRPLPPADRSGLAARAEEDGRVTRGPRATRARRGKPPSAAGASPAGPAAGTATGPAAGTATSAPGAEPPTAGPAAPPATAPQAAAAHAPSGPSLPPSVPPPARPPSVTAGAAPGRRPSRADLTAAAPG